MAELVDLLKEWFFGLGENYGVNPVIFGIIYVGAIPFFTLSIGWLVQNYRKKKPIFLPVLSSGFFFVSAYLYLIIAGRNVPIWVYFFIIILIAGGGFSTYKKVQGKIDEVDGSSE